MKIKIKKPGGFSLIELLFSMVFLSVIVFGVVTLQTSNLTIGNTQQNELKANFYASQALEIVSAIGYGVLGTTTCSDVSPCYLELLVGGNYSFNESVIETLDDGFFERSIEKLIIPPLNNAHLVTIYVSWSDSAGDHEVSAQKVVY